MKSNDSNSLRAPSTLLVGIACLAILQGCTTPSQPTAAPPANREQLKRLEGTWVYEPPYEYAHLRAQQEGERLLFTEVLEKDYPNGMYLKGEERKRWRLTLTGRHVRGSDLSISGNPGVKGFVNENLDEITLISDTDYPPMHLKRIK
jgi:hypothetical protein